MGERGLRRSSVDLKNLDLEVWKVSPDNVRRRGDVLIRSYRLKLFWEVKMSVHRVSHSRCRLCRSTISIGDLKRSPIVDSGYVCVDESACDQRKRQKSARQDKAPDT